MSLAHLVVRADPAAIEVMAAPRKYPDEVRERAARLVRHLVGNGEDPVTVNRAPGNIAVDVENPGAAPSLE